MSLIIAKLAAPSKTGPREIPSDGTKVARVLYVVDLGIQNRKPYQGVEKKPARMAWMCFELVDEKFEYNGEEVPFRISPQDMSFSLDPKSLMFKITSSLDPKNKLKGDLSKYLNMPCLVNVIHSTVKNPEGKDITYANFGGVSPMLAGVTVAELHDKPGVFSFDEPDLGVYNSLPDYIKTKIVNSPSFVGSKVEALLNSGDVVEPTVDEESPY